MILGAGPFQFLTKMSLLENLVGVLSGSKNPKRVYLEII